MGVTIDNLQIEIQTSSTNAAQGIDALATSLEKLKKNGSFKTVSNNLNNLSAALNNLQNVHSASNSLRTLANSIEKLKGVGTVSSLANSIKKLPDALKSLESINLNGVGSKIGAIVDAVSPLTQVKNSGFSSMVNSMGKLKSVTDSLNTETIDKFAEKVKKLNDIVEPFATKMGTIKTAISGINTQIKQTNVSIDQANAKVNVSVFNFSNLANVISTVQSALQSLIQGFSDVIDTASQWDGIEARFGRGFGAQAQETYEWIQRLNEEMGINIQQFMQYSSVYATMLTGFGVSNEDAAKMALGYTELTYDIWAGYNDIYRSFDEAAEAVRSAIAGEVEPVRRAGFTIIESTLEQTAANHGLEISLSNATEAQKSYLRYLTLVDQAHSQSLVGTYAKEMNTAEGVMRTFSQQLKSLTQAFGSLFLPVLVKVMPWVQAFVELLAEGVYWLAGLFGIEIQAVDFSDYEKGAGAIENVADSAGTATDALDSATQAAKELKNATLGIDELNVISPSSASSGGSGGSGGSGSGGDGFSGLDIDSLWDESIFDSVQSKVDEIKDRLKGMFDDWLPSLQIIGAALAGWGIANLLEQLGEALDLTDVFSGKVAAIKKLAATAIIITLQFKLMEDAFGDFMSEDGTILDYIEGVLIGAASTYLLYKQWGVGGLAIGLGVTAAVSLKTVIDEGGITDMESATVAITGLASAIGAFAAATKGLSDAWKVLAGTKFIGDLGAFIALAKEGSFVGALAAAFPKLSTALSSVGSALAGISAPVWAGIAAVLALVGSTVYFVVQKWDELTQAFQDFFDANIGPKLEEIKGHFEKIKESLSPLWDVLKPIFDGIKDFVSNTNFGEYMDAAGEAIGKAAEAVGWFVTTMSGFLGAGAFSAIVQVFEGIVQSISGVVQTFRGIIDFWVALFTGGDVLAALTKMKDGIVDIFGGLYSATIGAVIEFFDGIVGWFTEMWDVLVGHSIVPDTINDIVEWFTSLPGKIFSSIEEFVNGIIEKFEGLWNDLVSWWNSKPDLSEYTPSIGDIKEKLISAWESVKTWWNDTKENLAEYTPSIGSIKDKIVSAWNEAVTWWNEKKGTLATYTPSIGNISTKLSSAWESAKTWWKEKRSSLSYTPSIGKIWENLRNAWTSAKDWWNDKRSSLSYTPSIGSISSKLSSAWTTAKNWWNNNRSSLSYTPSIGSIKDKVVSAWNTAKNWWNNNVKLSTKLNIQVPTIKVKWDTASAFGKSFKYPTGFSLKFAANGGIFDQGSLIWAGERGPEVMATAAGGKTGVMNVQQMQDAVYEGVYAAVSAAMSGKFGDGAQAVNVYLDGRQITAAVEQRQRERGASILGNGVYSY